MAVRLRDLPTGSLTEPELTSIRALMDAAFGTGEEGGSADMVEAAIARRESLCHARVYAGRSRPDLQNGYPSRR